MARTPITIVSEVVASKHQVATQLGDEVVILGVDVGQYFGLNEVGARIWSLVQVPIRVSDLCAALETEYEVEASELQRDVLELLEAMQEKGLLDVAAPLGTP